jgi:hypothetical protein
MTGSPAIDAIRHNARPARRTQAPGRRRHTASCDIGAVEGRDTTAPDPPNITSPAEGSHVAGSFTISGTAEPNSIVEPFDGSKSLQVDVLVPASGIWSVELWGVSEGSRSYKAKATDEAGNTSAQSEARTMIVDTIAPTVKRVVPQEDATSITPGVNVSAVFSEAMRATSVKSAFKLYKKGSTNALEATVTYDATVKKAVLDPSDNLRRGATYKAVITTGVRDLAGNQLSQQKM